MKSIEKVKRQRRIKQIFSYCDNPMTNEALKIVGNIKQLNRVESKHKNSKFNGKAISHRRTLRRVNRTSN